MEKWGEGAACKLQLQAPPSSMHTRTSRCLALHGASQSALTASPRQYPSAEASRTLLRPSEAAIPALMTIKEDCGTSCSITPAATAPLDLPDRISEAARWQATRDPEHAVSIETAGPESPRRKAVRPGGTAAEPAVNE